MLGILVGTFGTLIGAGGGFVLVPFLLFLYPSRTTEQITAISLATVFFNAFSGSIAYARAGRIDYRAGLIFAAASIPGAILGAFTTQYIERDSFDLLFGATLILAGTYLYLRPVSYGEKLPGNLHSPKNIRNGILISLFVGFISSILGIGGGIIHVPAMIHVLGFPVHTATSTSHFVLAMMAFFGSLVHWYEGTLSSGIREVLILAPGVIIGAQIGASLSLRVHGKSIVRGLAIAISLVGVRLLFKG